MNRNNGRRERRRTRRDWFWACAREYTTGRPVVFGPHSTEVEAEQVAIRHLGEGEFVVYAFPTVNKIAARDMFKKKLEEQGSSLTDLFKRARYKL